MSWQNELYELYDRFYGKENTDGLLPISHSTANAQIQITLNEKGDFVEARQLTRDEAVTIIPVTEDSGARSSGICPMPLADKLVYIAGDYSQFATGKRADNSEFFSAYMKQLKQWHESEYTHLAVEAVYFYLSKKEVISDLEKSKVLQLDDGGKLDQKIKINGIAQQDAFVRFCVNYQDLERVTRTWLDPSLYESFISYNNSVMNTVQLCYATGKELPVTYKHPSKIRNSGDKAKLISSNDESGFTYRGRFRSKEETISVSYDFSQKMHNALKWIISRQGMYFEGMEFVVWEKNLNDVPDITKGSFHYLKKHDEEDDEFDDEEVITSEPQYNALLKKMIFGYLDKLEHDSKIMLLGLDAATTGRLSISMYSELDSSQFYANLEKWHRETAIYRYRKKHSEIGSFSVYEIVNYAYGTERQDKVICDKKVLSETILRLFPCITEGRRFPTDIVKHLFHKASNPQAYSKGYNHRLVLETACGMIRKMNIEKEKGVRTLAYDPNEENRSYLFGCLLAIADKAERDAERGTGDKNENDKRITNARRYWSMFAERPYQTWKVIEEKLNPYWKKLGNNVSTYYEKKIQEIMDKMTMKDFTSRESLGPEYLLGYHHYMAYLYAGKNKEEKENERITE